MRRQPGLPASDSCELVGPGILAVLGGLHAIFRSNPAVVDGLGAVVRGPSSARSGPDTLVCRILAVARGAVAGRSVEVTRRVVTRFSLLVTKSGRDVAALSSQPRLPAPHSCQLVGPRILEVLGGLSAIFGRYLPVVDCLGAVVGSFSMCRGASGTFARVLTIARRAIFCGSVEVTRRVVTSFGLSITLLGLSVTHVRGKVAVPSFYVALARGGKGVFFFIRAAAVLIRACHAEVHSSVT